MQRRALRHLRIWTMIKTRYAHRGYHSKPEIPENSIPAFKRAIERGFGAELDVHILRDESLAVFHDCDLFRCTGEHGIIEELDAQELKKLRLEGTENNIPLFDEVLELFEGKAPLIIELKTYKGNYNELSDAVCKRLKSYKGDFVLESFDPRALLRIRKRFPEYTIGQLSQNFFNGQEAEVAPWQRGILTNMWFNLLTRPDFIAYKFEDRMNAANRKYIKKGAQEVSWTIRSKEALETVEAAGAIAIFECFDPDL